MLRHACHCSCQRRIRIRIVVVDLRLVVCLDRDRCLIDLQPAVGIFQIARCIKCIISWINCEVCLLKTHRCRSDYLPCSLSFLVGCKCYRNPSRSRYSPVACAELIFNSIACNGLLNAGISFDISCACDSDLQFLSPNCIQSVCVIRKFINADSCGQSEFDLSVVRLSLVCIPSHELISYPSNISVDVTQNILLIDRNLRIRRYVTGNGCCIRIVVLIFDIRCLCERTIIGIKDKVSYFNRYIGLLDFGVMRLNMNKFVAIGP